MGFLKNRHLQFQGELHEIHLVNFSVEATELRDRIPPPIRPRLTGGRALISMVDVHLRNMRATTKWLPFRFHYQHIGFRVLVEDAVWNQENINKGIFFLESFSDRPMMVRAGNMVANYNLHTAILTNYPAGLKLEYGKQFLTYNLAGPILNPDDKLKALQAKIGAIDRAWAVEGEELQKTQIMREKWPLQPMNCTQFSTNFFESAKLEGVFRVTETIHYTWLPPETIGLLPTHIPQPIAALSHV